MPEGRLRRCFCEVPEELLLRLAKQRYVDGLSTLDLMHEATTPEEREAVGCVGLLGLSEEQLTVALDARAESTEHVRGCLRRIRERLAALGVEVR